MRGATRLSPAEEVAAARAALDRAAEATAAAYEATWNTRTQAAEDRAWARWHAAHDAQNRAAQRLHAAEERARWSRGAAGRWIRTP